MRLFTILASLAVVADVAVSSSWFSKAAYNGWHENELERWLSDHDIPYPTPADRKELENIVQKNWDSNIATPYQSWDSDRLSAYLKKKGVETKESAESSKDSLVSQVKNSWYETEDKAQDAWTSIKDWIFDSWTESQLKAFCDHHNIPVPQPRKRDTLLQKVRQSYDTVAEKAGEAAAYPGNWLYETWSESDLKEWLDTHGIPAPQPSTRDKLIASVRRNSRLACLQAQEKAEAASSSAKAMYEKLTDKVIDAWSESQLKEFCDKNSINVPQGTKLDQLRALVRKNRAEILGDTLAATAASYYGAATSNIAEKTDAAYSAASSATQKAFDTAIDAWSETRLKAYLDARGIPVPHASKKDELRALVRKHAHKAASGWTVWTFDDWTYDNLKQYLLDSGNAAAKKTAESADATRDDLMQAAQAAYTSASSAGGGVYASATNYLGKATDSAKTSAFDTWSESDIKSYLDSYGIPVPQGTTVNELRAFARKQYTYFKYGTSTPTDTIFAKLGESVKDGYQWVVGQLSAGAEGARKKAAETTAKVKEEL
ncbi:hypothetical protein P8C59_000736 [Phyllachora maydis]|uniref:Uncharacterized protein n=1 Tax=Phyllachora maydis TaxID=1825666 RepID=A0AAD9HWU8_9PEZI|nr:hypothetical protein P8C59_000736 [Phyllachora maydis]